MATKPKRRSMTQALMQREDVRSFLDAGSPDQKKRTPSFLRKRAPQPSKQRVAVTVRLPKNLADALID